MGEPALSIRSWWEKPAANDEVVSGTHITSDPIGLRSGLNTYGYVGGNPTGGVDPFGLAIADFNAADERVREILPGLGYKLPGKYHVEPPSLDDIRKGRVGYNKPEGWLFWRSKKVVILDYWGDDCFDDDQAKKLLNTYVHETLHFNQGYFVDYLMGHGSSPNYEYGVEKGIGDVLHNKIYESSNQITDRIFPEFNKLRKKYYNESGLDCECNN